MMIMGPGVWGCTNPLASNYNPLATIDDGSCILCSPNNYSANDIALLDSCCGKCDPSLDPLHPCYDFCNSDLAYCCDNHCENASIGLWDVNTSYNVGDVVEMVFQSGSYYYIALYDVAPGQTSPGTQMYPINMWDDCCIAYGQSPSYGPCNPITVEPNEPCDTDSAATWSASISYSAGDVVLHQGAYYYALSTGGGGVPGVPDISGQSKWALCERDDDNGSGDIFGCNDPLAVNYNPLATIDDGSCEDCVPGVTWAGFNMGSGAWIFEPDCTNLPVEIVPTSTLSSSLMVVSGLTAWLADTSNGLAYTSTLDYKICVTGNPTWFNSHNIGCECEVDGVPGFYGYGLTWITLNVNLGTNIKGYSWNEICSKLPSYWRPFICWNKCIPNKKSMAINTVSKLVGHGISIFLCRSRI